MYGAIKQHLATQIDEIRKAGLFKGERVLTSPQQAHVGVQGRTRCSEHVCEQLPRPGQPPRGRARRPIEALDRWGNGMASVRFICGTQEPHKELEKAISNFLGTEDTILYSSCWDANGGLFETILGAEDAVISDELNHASIIDGIRLVQGAAAALQEQRHGRPGGQAPGSRGRPVPADRHRRRLLDGRHHRQPEVGLRPGREVRRAGDGRRLARRRLHGQDRPRDARVSRRDGPRRHPHRHAGQGPGRRQRRLHQLPGPRS